MQEFTYCGFEKESCVEKANLRDKSCLVPCVGLYADIADDSLKQTLQAFDQTVMRGRILIRFFPSHLCTTGFHMLTRELGYDLKQNNLNHLWSQSQRESKERLHDALQQMFPASAYEKVEELKLLTERYHKYKSDYVKHLCVNLDNENLSK